VYLPLKASDGYLMLAAVSPRNFEMLLDAIGIEGWREDAMLSTDRARQQNWTAVMARIEAWTSQRSCAEGERIIGGAGVPITPFRTVREALAEPQLAHRGSMAREVDGAGEYRVPNLPFKFSGGHVQVREHVPGLGEDSERVLAELAGLRGEALRAVIAKGRGAGG
jgi:crotonobetainyl-CoA:carnitine CoA-transferase CaiB-like acyl-CoA transferase